MIVAGPTGAGKSALALELASRFGAELVNIDAFQIYRGMRIGTAQPSPEEQKRAPHWLYDFCDPRAGMSAAAFSLLVDKTVAEIAARGRPVVLVGGAGFYLRAVLYGLFEAPPVDAALRASLGARAQTAEGREALHRELAAVDPAAAARLPAADAYRVTRALEIFLQTGKPLSVHHQEHARGPRYRFTLVALDPPAEELAARQAARIEAMLREGWLDEVRALLAEGISDDAPGMKAIGYRALSGVLRGERTLAAARAEITKEHKAYAKRQRTWLRAERGVEWVSRGSLEEVSGLAARVWGKGR